MKVFITGTDTNIGKTIISSWIALHTGFSYFKPIQTGTLQGSDTTKVAKLSKVKTYPEVYSYSKPSSPHLAATIENQKIDITKISLPKQDRLIIEGAGGLLVPLNNQHFIIDVIQRLRVPVILVTRTCLGTINHTLLSLEALRSRNIKVLGVIMNGEKNLQNKHAIELYGNIPVIYEFPQLLKVNYASLKKMSFSDKITQIFHR